jgi:bla regulator protein BlaR1
MADVIPWLQSTSAWVWAASWQATAVAALVMAVQWTFRRVLPARWRNALWLLVFTRLLMPALPQAPFSAYNWLPKKAPLTTPAPLEPEAPPPAHPAPGPSIIPVPEERAPLAAIPSASTNPIDERPPLPLLPIAWAAGVLAMLGSGVAGYLRMQRRVMRMRRSVPAALREEFEAAKAKMHVRRADLMVSEAVATPMVSGVWRATIILPPDLESTLPAADVRMVLLHELAHVKRGDLWVAWLAWIAGGLHWFNPAIWFAIARARKDREMACDEWVLRYVPDFNAYGSALVRFLETRQVPRLPLGSIGIFESKSALLQRVRRIAGYRPPTVLGSAIGAALLAAVGLLTLTGARGAKPGAPADASDAAWPIEHAAQPLVIRCEDEDGHAVPNAEVYLLQWHGSFQMYQYSSAIPITPTGPLLTDAAGEAKFPNPITFHHGDYRREIYARVPGKLVAGWFGNGEEENGSAENPGTGKPVVLKMTPVSPLRGRVQFTSGADPRLATVTLLGWLIDPLYNDTFGPLDQPGQPEPWPQLIERKPDRDGWFEFQDVPGKGLAYVAANAPGSGESQYMMTLDARTPFTMLLEPESVIEGRATFAPSGKPAAGIRVYARSRAVTGSYVMHAYAAITGPDGKFRIGGLFAGPYVVSAERSPDWTVEPVQLGIRPDQPGAVSLVLEPGAIAIGKVTEQKSHLPVSGAMIAAIVAGVNGEGLDSAMTDTSGNYRLRLPTGQSRIYVGSLPGDDLEYPGDQGHRTITVAGGRVSDGSLDFAIARAKSTGPPAVGALARGRVLDPDGKPVPNALISFDCKPLPGKPQEPGAFLGGGPSGYSKADGAYEVKLYANCDYQLSVGGILQSTATSRRFTTGSGTLHQIEDLVVRPALSSAAGVVVDEQGRPVANVKIDPSSPHKYAYRANAVQSDGAGRFQIPHLLDDEWFRLTLDKPGYARRDLYGIPPGVTDLRIVMVQQAEGGGPESGGQRLADGKRLIGGAAPAWDAQEWIQKEDPSPAPKRGDGRWTLLVFDQSGDRDGAELKRLEDVAKRLNLAPVLIYDCLFDEHLPRWILRDKSPPVTVGLDRYTAGAAANRMGERGATRIAYGSNGAYLIDPDGIVRATPNDQLEGIEAVMGKDGAQAKP